MESVLDIPPVTDPRWRQVLTGARNPELRTLATRLLVTRLKIAVKGNRMPLDAAAAELRQFFVVNSFAQRDLAAI
jgi:hypothetical protein